MPAGGVLRIKEGATPSIGDKMKKEIITPTLYSGHQTCEKCGAKRPCFSVLCSWPDRGQLLSDNKMVCKKCLEGVK